MSGVVILLTIVFHGRRIVSQTRSEGSVSTDVVCLSLTAYWSKSFKDDLVFQMYGLVTVCVCAQ